MEDKKFEDVEYKDEKSLYGDAEIPSDLEKICIQVEALVMDAYFAGRRSVEKEYKDWCTEEWELYGEAIGEQKMDFSTAPGSPQTYTIPAGINSGEHYVVVAYFADCEMDYGEYPDSDADDVLVSNQMKSFMSEVMVK